MFENGDPVKSIWYADGALVEASEERTLTFFTRYVWGQG